MRCYMRYSTPKGTPASAITRLSFVAPSASGLATRMQKGFWISSAGLEARSPPRNENSVQSSAFRRLHGSEGPHTAEDDGSFGVRRQVRQVAALQKLSEVDHFVN